MIKKGFGKANLAIIQMFNKGYTCDKLGNVYNPKGHIVNGSTRKFRNSEYYKTLSFKLDSIPYSILKHRFIAFCKFKHDLFKEEMVVRHLNGNSLDNSWNNIEIGTHSQNMMDIPREQRRKMASSPKYDHFQIIKDSKVMARKEVMEKHGMSSTGAYHYIVNRSLALIC